MLLTQRVAKLWHNSCWSGAQKPLHTPWSSTDPWKGNTNMCWDKGMRHSVLFIASLNMCQNQRAIASCKWAQNTHVLSTLVPLLRLLRGYSSKHTNRPAALSLLRIHTNDIYIELSIDTVSFDTLDEYMRKWHENLGLPKNTSINHSFNFLRN